MNQLILYHGSNIEFEKVDLSQSRNKRDFGIGFYMTTYPEQAKDWATVLFDRYGGFGRYLYRFMFDFSEELNIKRFDGLTSEWLGMVKENRTKGGVQHNYDTVTGPVANDRTMPTITLFVNGIISEAAALEQLKYYKANDQVSVHTEKALNYLELIEKVKL